MSPAGKAEIGSGRSLVIVVQGELYAMSADRVEEVLPGVRVSTLPGMPEHVAGVVRYRDRWIPLIDAGPPLGLAAGPRSSAVVLKRGRIRFALGVDRVAGIREAGDADQDITTAIDPDSLFAAPLPAGEEHDPMADTEVRAAPVSAVVFKIGRHDLGIEITHVHEVLPWRQPAPVPRAPDFVEGVIELRGEVLPIVDMRARLGVEAPPPGPETRFVVVAMGEERIGLVVDQVTEVSRIPDSAVSKPPQYFRGLAAELIQGLARFGDRLVVLLHIDKILSSDEHLQLLDTDFSDVKATPAPESGEEAAAEFPWEEPQK